MPKQSKSGSSISKRSSYKGKSGKSSKKTSATVKKPKTKFNRIEENFGVYEGKNIPLDKFSGTSAFKVLSVDSGIVEARIGKPSFISDESGYGKEWYILTFRTDDKDNIIRSSEIPFTIYERTDDYGNEMELVIGCRTHNERNATEFITEWLSGDTITESRRKFLESIKNT